ncbi:GNAT family N-acetyltransferase [Phycicoccus sp. CSK15P-2]|uniref:GNAT family N-acetyltransferase n=1 Tax=Phycicoccus sp. CSK15P-2 TaxID=2807627 RepID=UPI00194F9DC7|nr:GNAT family N-acetyltransferase [Phycicoccus sp. CSK15P-2]MBM6405959.1 GNAT family N-acetyltransferase [Phycicoccus sp. CSK15P-2]
MSWDSLGGTGVMGALSVYDTRRFGMRVARMSVRAEEHDVRGAAREIMRHWERLNVRIAVVRWPLHAAAVADHLTDAGMTVVPADRLAYWGADLFASPPVGSDSAVVPLSAQPELADAVAEATAETFRGYRNHYEASECFPAEDVLAGYVEWARRCIDTRPEHVVVAVDGDEVTAFATTTPLADGQTLEVDLAGTVEARRREGWYSRLVDGLLSHAEALGFDRVVISTQEWNRPVQAVWARAGFRGFAAFETVHLTRTPADDADT